MTIRDLGLLSELTNPTDEGTLFIVQDSSVPQTLTAELVRELLSVQGDNGPQGPVGYTGSRGIQGPQGYTGSASIISGPQGPQGYTGSRGDTGSASIISGPQGPQGYTGSRGDTGSASIISGPQGPQGYTGSQGIPGYTGSIGAPSTIAENLQGGTTGSILIQSSANVTSFIPIGAPGYILQSNGTTATWVSTSTIVSGQADQVYVDLLANSNPSIYYPTMALGPTGYSTPAVNSNVNYVANTGIFTAPKINVSSSTNATSTTTGAIVTVGGLAVGKDIHFGGNIYQNGVLFNPIGSPGYTGSSGYTGSIGDFGYTGSRGIQGPQGPTGFTGSASTAPGYTGSAGAQSGAEFVFQNVGFNYSVDGFSDTSYPTLTVVRGQLYYFNLTNITSSHPLALRLSSGDTSNVPGTTGNDPSVGNFGNGSIPTTVIYRVPFNAPSSIVYQCVVHSGMIGIIGIVDQIGYTGSSGSGYTGSASTAIGPTGFTGSFGYTGSASTVSGPSGPIGTVTALDGGPAYDEELIPQGAWELVYRTVLLNDDYILLT